MGLRVVQWGTGNVGKHALRAILRRSDLELVGLKVYSDDKVGRDAGDLCGMPATGVLATTSVAEILAIDADCANFSALGATIDPYGATLDDICLLLASGRNVISSANEALVYPPAAPKEVQRRLADACAEGSSTFFASGVNPGFTMDVWPITMTRLSSSIDRIHIVETLDMKEYTSVNVMRFMGFGESPDTPSLLDEMHTDPDGSPFYASLLMTADALHFELEDYRYEREVGLATESFEIASGTIAAGTIAVVKMAVVGIAKGRDVLVNEWVWRVDDRVRPEWGIGQRWNMQIDGDPSMTCSVEATTELDSKRVVSLTVATSTVNAIPTVCAASPGVKTPLELPMWGGGALSD